MGMDDDYTVSEAARILGVGGHRIRQMLRDGDLEGRRDDISGRWFADKRSVHAHKEERDAKAADKRPSESREGSVSDLEWVFRVEDLQRELGRLEGRLEITEVAESTLRESLQRERERADRLEEELRAERSKGFWQRLFGR